MTISPFLSLHFSLTHANTHTHFVALSLTLTFISLIHFPISALLEYLSRPPLFSLYGPNSNNTNTHTDGDDLGDIFGSKKGPPSSSLPPPPPSYQKMSSVEESVMPLSSSSSSSTQAVSIRPSFSRTLGSSSSERGGSGDIIIKLPFIPSVL